MDQWVHRLNWDAHRPFRSACIDERSRGPPPGWGVRGPPLLFETRVTSGKILSIDAADPGRWT